MLAVLQSSIGRNFGGQSRAFATGSRILEKVKAARDPARPKVPPTAYFQFLADFRQNQSTGVKGSETAKQAAVAWRSLVMDRKRPYEESYAKQKEVYDVAFSEYRNSGKLANWKRDPRKPKRPLTGFMRFAQEYRQSASPTMKMTEVTKAAGAEWKTISASQKGQYEQAYKQEKATYDQALKKYKESGMEAEFKKRTGLTAAEEKLASKREAKRKQELKKKQLLKKQTLSAKKKAAKTKLDAKKKKEGVAQALKQKREAVKVAKKKAQIKKKTDNLKAALKKLASEEKKLSKTPKKVGKRTVKRAKKPVA